MNLNKLVKSEATIKHVLQISLIVRIINGAYCNFYTNI